MPSANAQAVEIAIDQAVLRTLAYSDLFDFPMRVDEIQRYLVGIEASRAEVESTLRRMAPHHVRIAGPFVTLPGREDLVPLRLNRESRAAELWPEARRYGRRLARLPFVRMVTVTGALAAGNPETGGDVDFLLVTETGRLWSCRAAAIQLVRIARLRRVVLCPNYLVSEAALEVPEHTLFVARELAQMVPLAGWEVYRRIRRQNGWVLDLLPNASGPPPGSAPEPEPRAGRARRTVEAVLRTRLGARLEAWEMRRKIREIGDGEPLHPEVILDRDRCKGHTSGHGERILRAYGERLRELGLPGLEETRGRALRAS